MGNPDEYERNKVRFVKTVEGFVPEIKAMWETIKDEAIRRNDIEFLGNFASALSQLNWDLDDFQPFISSELQRQIIVGGHLPKDRYQNKPKWELVQIADKMGLGKFDEDNESITREFLQKIIRSHVYKERPTKMTTR